jgi:tetraacyldisaccharide 4'-kinase
MSSSKRPSNRLLLPSYGSVGQIREWIARSLEGGRLDGPCAEYASRAWEAIARVERPLRWRDGARVVVVGGSTLGGSGKTPLAVACAEELRHAGANVALVGHGYGASPAGARIVSERDDVRSVGDEALACARRLARFGVPVVVSRARQEALDLALRWADVVVVDGPCQTVPRRATLSLLAVDSAAPWGAGRCPPRGDLRVPVEALLAAVDRVVVIGGDARSFPEVLPIPAHHANAISRGAWMSGPWGFASERRPLIGWDELRPLRLGLWTAIARPDRVLRALERHGIVPKITMFGADHYPRGGAHPLRSMGPVSSLDLWLTTTKCEGHIAPDLRARGPVGGGPFRGESPDRGANCGADVGVDASDNVGVDASDNVGAHVGVDASDRVPVAVLDYALSLDSGLKELLRSAATGGVATYRSGARVRPIS